MKSRLAKGVMALLIVAPFGCGAAPSPSARSATRDAHPTLRRNGRCTVSAQTTGNTIVATTGMETECRRWDDASQGYKDWEMCETTPGAKASLSVAFANDVGDCETPPCKTHRRRDDRTRDIRTNPDASVAIDLSSFDPPAAFADEPNATLFIRGSNCRGGDATVDLSACPLFSEWKEAATKKTAELVARREQSRDAHAKGEAEREKWKAECERGNNEACVLLGKELSRISLETARVVPGTIDLGIPYLRKACAMNYEPACAAVQEQLAAAGDLRTKRQEATAAQAAQLATRETDALKARCMKGDRPACAAMNFVNRCEQGVSDACDSAGNAHLVGAGVEKDLQRTRNYWRRACEIAPARCAGYGIKIQNTSGFPGGQQLAKEFFEQGCSGDANQCVTVGTLFLRGAGVPRDATMARDYFKRGCDAGVAASCQSLNLK